MYNTILTFSNNENFHANKLHKAVYVISVDDNEKGVIGYETSFDDALYFADHAKKYYEQDVYMHLHRLGELDSEEYARLNN